MADALSDTVRARLEHLLAEAPPRRALEDDEDPSASAPAAEPAERPGWRRPWGRRQALVVLLVLGVGLAAAAWSVLSARAVPLPDVPEPIAVSSVPSTEPPATPVPSAAPVTSQPPELVVHVLGAVARPGVVRLPPGARVQDAIAAAGGLTADAAPGELNLAAPLADGSQVVIGRKGAPRGEVRPGSAGTHAPGAGPSGPGGAGPAATPGAGDRLDLNAASLEQLDALPGVGPVTAQRILDWRSQHGRFSKVEELQEVDGIGPKTYARLAELVRV